MYCTLCNAKVGIGKHDTLAPTYKGLIKVYSTNNVEYEFWFYHDDIKCCVSNNKKKMYWIGLVPNTWPMKICTNVSREEVFVLKDAIGGLVTSQI